MGASISSSSNRRQGFRVEIEPSSAMPSIEAGLLDAGEPITAVPRPSRRLQTKLLDCSYQGLRLFVKPHPTFDELILVGHRVRIQLEPDTLIEGSVRHVIREPDGFLIGCVVVQSKEPKRAAALRKYEQFVSSQQRSSITRKREAA